MRTETRGEVGAVKSILSPPVIFYITDLSKAFQGNTSDLVLCVCLFWCQFLYYFHLLCV